MKSQMLRLPLRKKYLILASLISLTACASANCPPPVYCHTWRDKDARAIENALTDLSPLSPLHPVIRDYERVCIALK